MKLENVTADSAERNGEISGTEKTLCGEFECRQWEAPPVSHTGAGGPQFWGAAGNSASHRAGTARQLAAGAGFQIQMSPLTTESSLFWTGGWKCVVLRSNAITPGICQGSEVVRVAVLPAACTIEKECLKVKC